MFPNFAEFNGTKIYSGRPNVVSTKDIGPDITDAFESTTDQPGQHLNKDVIVGQTNRGCQEIQRSDISDIDIEPPMGDNLDTSGGQPWTGQNIHSHETSVVVDNNNTLPPDRTQPYDERFVHNPNNPINYQFPTNMTLAPHQQPYIQTMDKIIYAPLYSVIPHTIGSRTLTVILFFIILTITAGVLKQYYEWYGIYRIHKSRRLEFLALNDVS
jgi:hypothetical protein